MSEYSQVKEGNLLLAIAEGDKKAFDFLFTSYYIDLCRTAIKYVRKEHVAEEIVLDVFLSIWNRRETLKVDTSLKSYLNTATKYRAINYLRSRLAKEESHRELSDIDHPTSNETEEFVVSQELEKLIQQAFEALPEKCRVIFGLSRNGSLTYKEIATELNLSIKTVETQMSIALKRMKAFLDQHWDKIITPLLLFTMPGFF